MTFQNRYVLKGKSKHWIYNGGCEYDCEFHYGKVEWHHPISKDGMVGVYLCEAHHSLIYGRKHGLPGETIVKKSYDQMRSEIQALVIERIKERGYTEDDIDKN